MISYRLVL